MLFSSPSDLVALFEGIHKPCDTDILFGRGYNNHAGNKKFSKFVDTYKVEYQEAEHGKKASTVMPEVLRKWQKNWPQSRFLEKIGKDAEQEWAVVSSEGMIEEKILKRLERKGRDHALFFYSIRV